jgi:DNA-directed RNA polymerase subunit omega
VDSKYTLVHLAARRAREINNYYHSLGEGLGQYTPPLVEQVDSNKPLSIALEEIATGKIVVDTVGDARHTAARMLGEDQELGEAQVLSLDTDGEDEDS